jgi:hypothetical protein
MSRKAPWLRSPPVSPKEHDLIAVALGHRVHASQGRQDDGILDRAEAGARQLQDLAGRADAWVRVLPGHLLTPQDLEDGLLMLAQLLDQLGAEGGRGVEPQAISRGDEGHTTAVNFEEGLSSGH